MKQKATVALMTAMLGSPATAGHLGDDWPPRIDTPQPKKRILLNVTPEGLPPGARGYRTLYDFEKAMTYQWATAGSPGGPPAFKHNGPHTTNKVTAGFARGGLFLIPPECIDSDPASEDFFFCPSGENGGDAVIDIDDNDPGDDFFINNVEHPEFDFLELGSPDAPIFHVWTGPRYRFSADGSSTFNNPTPCNKQFRVEVSNDPDFQDTTMSPWMNVDTNPQTPQSPECYGTWQPNSQQWQALQEGGDRVYYRARTRMPGNQNIRLSTTPGAGMFDVPPPYGMITEDGQSDY